SWCCRRYNLSDDQAEFFIQERLFFLQFLWLGLSDKVPDAKTIWLFRESLVRAARRSSRRRNNAIRSGKGRDQAW
ncbi:MAG: transposase, partial [Pararhizobium sp.]